MLRNGVGFDSSERHGKLFVILTFLLNIPDQKKKLFPIVIDRETPPNHLDSDGVVCNQWDKIEVELLARTLLEVVVEGDPLDWDEVSATVGSGGKREHILMNKEHIEPNNCKLKFNTVSPHFHLI